MRRLILIVISAVMMLPLGAEGEVFFSNIINASFLTDFAYSVFPVSFWGEFGIDNLDFFEDLDSRAVVRVEAGMAQRTLRQDPQTGEIITDHNPGQAENYSVVFSDGSVGIDQGLIDNPDPSKPDFLTLSFSVGMRWEQAFASLYDIQHGNFSGLFGNKDYFPDSAGGNFPGTPELSGNLYALSNYVNLSLIFRNLDNHYLYPEGYNFSASITPAPWWLFNDLPMFETRTDYYRMIYSASWKHTILSQNQKARSDMNLYSLVVDFNMTCQFLFGSAVPRHAYSVSFRTKEIPPRAFMTDAYAAVILNGPEFLTKGTYPELIVFIENALSAGDVLNSTMESDSVKFYGTLGARLRLHILGFFQCHVGFYYDYLPMEGYAGGVSLDLGAYFTAMF